jgi:hypothetical protein
VYVHVPGKPVAHRNKYAPRGIPGRFLGFARPLGLGIYRVKLDSGREVQSQTVVFDGAPCAPPPILQPAHASQTDAAAMLQADSDSESDTEAPQALKERHVQGQQIGLPQQADVGEMASEPAQPLNQLVHQQNVDGLRRSERVQQVPEGFNPEPMTRREQAADQQARARTASWGQVPRLMQGRSGVRGVPESVKGQGVVAEEDRSGNKRAPRSQRVG